MFFLKVSRQRLDQNMSYVRAIVRFIWLSLLLNSIGLIGVCIVLANDMQYSQIVTYCLIAGIGGLVISVLAVALSPYLKSLICSSNNEDRQLRENAVPATEIPEIHYTQEDPPIALTIIETENKIIYAVDIHQLGPSTETVEMEETDEMEEIDEMVVDENGCVAIRQDLSIIIDS